MEALAALNVLIAKVVVNALILKIVQVAYPAIITAIILLIVQIVAIVQNV